MIADLKPYPAYKDSDVEWLGEVPEGWEVRRLKFTSDRLVNGIWGGDPDGVDDIPCVRVADFDRERLAVKTQIPTRRAITSTERNSRLLRRGDLLLEKSGGGEQQPVGVVVEYKSDVSAVSSNFVARVRPRSGFISRYLTYLHCALYAKRINVRSVKQTTGIQNLDGDGYLAERVPLAPTSEQEAIAQFLDHADSRIQRFVAAKERLVELLAEEKQAIIHRTLSRGLDPISSLRPSGVAWLGNVPEHWDVLDLGRVIDLLPGFAFSSEKFSEDPRDVRLLRGVNITPGKIRWDETVRWPIGQQDAFDSYALRVGDLVLGLDRPIVGAGIRVARIGAGDTPSLLLQRVARLRALPGLLSEYAELLLRSELFGRYIAPIFTGISVPHLSPEQVKRFRISLPPLSEQEEIIEFTAAKAAAIDAAINVALRQLALIGEYRTRLISDVVTGKLDVRKAAEQLPDDPDADDPVLDQRLEEAAAA